VVEILSPFSWYNCREPRMTVVLSRFVNRTASKTIKAAKRKEYAMERFEILNGSFFSTNCDVPNPTARLINFYHHIVASMQADAVYAFHLDSVTYDINSRWIACAQVQSIQSPFRGFWNKLYRSSRLGEWWFVLFACQTEWWFRPYPPFFFKRPLGSPRIKSYICVMLSRTPSL
jgi:hypothetical protein